MTTTTGRQEEIWEKGIKAKKGTKEKPMQYYLEMHSANPLGTILFCSKDLQGTVQDG